MRIVTINTSKKYNVYIDNNILFKVSELLLINGIDTSRRILVITDTNVDKFSNDLVDGLANNNYICDKFVIDSGETSKNLSTVEKILRYLAKNNFKKNDILIALGGGVIGDITGLCASLYMRGISFIQIPTTLLSAVDASVGGKTAIDIPEGKNMVGTFYQPRLVICDCDVIKKLPNNIFEEGVSEIIKYGVISDNRILDVIEENKLKENLDDIIERCVEIKAGIVSKDENDEGLRKILNFGHTYAHAIEKCSNYVISHGQAVAEGLVFETMLSSILLKCSLNYYKRIVEIVRKRFSFNQIFNFKELYNAMKNDKKNDTMMIKFVAVDGKNNTELMDVDKHVIEKAYNCLYK